MNQHHQTKRSNYASTTTTITTTITTTATTTTKTATTKATIKPTTRTTTVTVTKPQHTIQRPLPYQQEAKKTSTRHLRTRHITKQKNHKSIGHCLHKTQHKTVYSIKTYYPGKIIHLANQLVS
jgi:hypothetical protein